MNTEDFKTYYAQLTDGELAKIASARRTLVPEAQVCLDYELSKRRLSPDDLKRFRNDRHDYRQEVDPVVRKMRRSMLFGKINELSKMPRLRWRGILVMIACTIPAVFLFDHFGMLDFFRPVFGSIVVLFFILRCHWELKNRPWFWVTLGVWAAVHVLLILRVQWPSGWVPARVFEGCMTIDLVAIFMIIALIEKLFHEGTFARETHAAQE